MNTTANHVVEGTDLPTYDHRFGSQSYLHLGHGNKITVPDQHVAYLRHLATAATNLADLIDEAHEPKTPEVKYETPDEWLPGDQIVDFDGDVWVRSEAGWSWTDSSTKKVHPSSGGDNWVSSTLVHTTGTRITHLVPREPKSEPELQHPGTWLPGDQFEDFDGDIWTRSNINAWTYRSPDGDPLLWTDHDIDGLLEKNASCRIAHLAPRANGAS